FGAMDNDTVLYTTDDNLPEKITNKLTCPDYWVIRYTHWGNLASWEISYCKIHPNSSIIECYNALKEDIFSSAVYGNNNKFRKLESLRIKVKQIETAEQSSSRQRIDQGTENDDNDLIQDNDFNESESIVHSCKQKVKCFLLKNYCEMQSHHIDEDSQQIFINAGWENNPKMINISTLRVALDLLAAVFKEHPNDELRSIATILQLLRRHGKICTSDYDMTAILYFLFSNHPRDYYDIDVLTASSAITEVISYTDTPVRGTGSNPSENHVIAELWLRIFSTAFKLHKLRFLPVLELQHLVSEFERNEFDYDENKSLLFYVYGDDVLSFNFHERNTESNEENVLRLVTYLRETVSADGMRIRTLFNRHPAQFNYNLKVALPILASEAVRSRTFEMKFTPPSKR
ncbi:20996_t:CDS:2, partial [Cetraspora pellucida]